MPALPGYRRYRVPRGDGELLVDPPSSTFAQLVAQHRGVAGACDVRVGGRSLAELSAAARREAIAAALNYTQSYRDVSPQLLDRCAAPDRVPIVATGHQAEMFHPGVWLKNFVLDRTSRSLQAIALHLVIDTDICHRASIKVPSGSVAEPRQKNVSFAAGLAQAPLEVLRVAGDEHVESFAERVGEALDTLVPTSLVAEFWPLVREQLPAVDGRIGWAIARGRHTLEQHWGLDTLEIPQSLVCQLPAVQWLHASLLVDLPLFRTHYNEALDRYRRAHRLRSPAQPMPDLAAEADWLEAPFWVYDDSHAGRRPLMVRQTAGKLELSDRDRWQVVCECSCDAVVAALAAADSSGRHIRTRALTTTLVARLLLGDLFLHGIGGAKYDEVTSDFAARYFGVEIAPYSAVSGTVLLPIEHRRVTRSDLTAVDVELRDMRFHPERFVEDDRQDQQNIVANKWRWISTPKTPQNAATRHVEIERANRWLAESIADRRATVEAKRAAMQPQARATRILESREYAFCLYPGDFLREQLTQLASQAAQGLAAQVTSC